MENVDQETAAGDVKVNVDSPPIKKTFKKVYLIGPLFIIFLLILVLFNLKIFKLSSIIPVGNPIVAEVGSNKIFLSNYKERLFAATNQGTPDNPGFIDDHLKEPILNELIEMAILDKNLPAGSVSEDGIVKAAVKYAGNNYSSGNNKVKKAYENYVKLDLEREKLTQDDISWKEGFALFCMYDRAYQDDYGSKKLQAQTLLIKQKTYAQDYCEKTKQRLESGSTYSKELKALENDPVIGKSAWSPPYTVAFGFTFDKAHFTPDYFPTQVDLLNKIKALGETKGKYSIVTVNSLLEDIKGKDVWDVLVYIKDEKTGFIGDYKTWFRKQMITLKVKTYPENIKL